MKNNNNYGTYCVLPFNSVSITAHGDIRHCCNGGYDVSDYKLPNVSNLTTEEIINNDFIQDLRDSFIKEERHPACNRCWKMEDMNIMSFREVANRYKRYDINVTGRKNIQKSINFDDIEYIDITLGNKCNLACRMCLPSSSSLLAKQQKEIGIHNGEIDIEHSADNKEKILDLFAKAKNLKKIYMLGGEPLINEFHYEILDLLIAKDRAKNVEIYFNTNLKVNKISSYYPIWEKFNSIYIQASIDGTHECYEYIRYPGKWDKLYKSFKELSDIIDQKKYLLSISPVLQNLNVHNIVKLVEELRFTGKFETGWFFIPVSGPNQLHIVPKITIREAIEQANKLPDTKAIPKQSLLNMLQTALTKKVTQDELRLFFYYTQKYDQYRKQNIFEMAPHFLDLANKFKLTIW